MTMCGRGWARAVAETAMRKALLGKDKPTDVINVALEALAAAGCELPGYSTLDEMAWNSYG